MSGPVLFFVPGHLSQRQGPQVYDRRIIEGLRKTGWTVGVHELPGRPPFSLQSTQELADQILADTPDRTIVVVDGLCLPALASSIALEQKRLRFVGVLHHSLTRELHDISESESEQFRHLESVSLLRLHHVVANSHFTARRLLDAGVPSMRLSVVSPGTDPEIPAIGSGEKPLTLMAIGGIMPRKGYDVLIHALAEMKDLDWRLVIAGSLVRDPRAVAALTRIIVEESLEDRILLMGEADAVDVAAALHRSDVFVHPSFYEGYGMAVAEAMKRGVPIVATTGGAMPELVPPEAGLLVEPGDVPAMAAALRQIITDVRLRATLSEGSLAAGLRLPGWDDAASLFAAVLRRMAAA